MSLRIGISGSYGGLNLGDEAILEVMIEEFRRHVDAEIIVFSRNAEHTSRTYRVRAVPVRQLGRREIAAEVGALDLFVLGGGGLLYDSEAAVYLREVNVAIEQQVPVMTYSISAGPLHRPENQQMVAKTLNHVDVITVREERARRLLEDIGVTKRITVTADPALLLKPEDFPLERFHAENIREEGMLVAISVREPGPAAPDLSEEHYHFLIANAADFLVERLGAQCLFVPMESQIWDLQHSHAIVAKMANAHRAHVMKVPPTPGQLLGMMKYANFAMGMRLHFLVFAALQHVSFVPLPYASKVLGLLDDLGLPQPPIQEMNAGQLCAYIDRSWDQREFMSKQLSVKLPALQERARLATSLALKLLPPQKKAA
ncbi:MAG: polysaccharide pyruvyl transferase family protein [Actinobacteria bacterium]|nr:polysaccharide pyruvyl transferase family protein [Actinomycetota bacterium]